MKMEFANGSVMEVNDSENLKKHLGTLNEDNDFAILNAGESFIQASLNNGGYLFQYNEAGIMYESTETDATLEKVIIIFDKYLLEDISWKEDLQWEKMSDSGNNSGITDFRSFIPQRRNNSGNLKDEFLNTAKHTVINWIKRKIR